MLLWSLILRVLKAKTMLWNLSFNNYLPMVWNEMIYFKIIVCFKCSCVCAWVNVYHFIIENVSFCQIFLLGKCTTVLTSPGCDGRPAYFIVDTTLKAPWVRKQKEAATRGRGCGRHRRLCSGTQGSFSYTQDFTGFSNDHLGLDCGLWCEYFISMKFLTLHSKIFTYFLSHYWLCTCN